MTTNNTHDDKPIKILAKDRILTDILTLVVILTVIGAVCVFIAPGTIETNRDVIILSINTLLHDSSDAPTVIIVDINDSIVPEPSNPSELTDIESLIADLTWANPADKAQYNKHPDKVDEVHVCTNMAVEQAEWIIENYDYDVGIVILHNRYIGDNHVQTWVNINGTRYVIDSTSNYYWTEEGHINHWKDKYGIQYTNVEKGREHEKVNNEMLNNKDAPQSAGCGGGPRPLRTDVLESTPTPDVEVENIPESTIIPDTKNDIIIMMDVSESTSSEIIVGSGVTFLDYEKALILDIIDDKNSENSRIGVVFFGRGSNTFFDLNYLDNKTRKSLQEEIMRVKPDGGDTTNLNRALKTTRRMISNSVGSKDVIIISDGNIETCICACSHNSIARMNDTDMRMHFIHVMSSPNSIPNNFEDLARDVDGTYQQTTYPYIIYPYSVI